MFKKIIRLFVALTIAMSLSTVVYANGNTETDINSVKKSIEQLSKQSDELSNKIEHLSKDELIKSLQDGQDKLIQTADHAINRVNMWIAVFSVAVSISIAAGTIVTYFVQTKKFEKLEEEIKEYKAEANDKKKELEQAHEEIVKAEKQLESSTNEVLKAKNDLKELEKEIEEIRLGLRDARAQAEIAAGNANLTKNQLEEQQLAIEEKFEEMKYGLQDIRKEVTELAEDAKKQLESEKFSAEQRFKIMKEELEDISEEVQALAEKARISESNAKKSEDMAKASQYFNEAYNEKDLNKKIELYTKAIDQDNDFAGAYNNRGIAYYDRASAMDVNNTDAITQDCNNAINDYNFAIKIYNDLEDYEGLGLTYLNRGFVYQFLGDNVDANFYEKAIDDFNYVIKQSVCSNMDKSDACNNYAMIFRSLKKFDEAKEMAEKAILECNSNGIAYATLAEVYAEKNNDEEFYKNIELALFNNYPVWECSSTDKVYAKYLDKEKFIDLINKYKK